MLFSLSHQKFRVKINQTELNCTNSAFNFGPSKIKSQNLTFDPYKTQVNQIPISTKHLKGGPHKMSS